MATTEQQLKQQLSQQDFDFLFPRSRPVVRLTELPAKLGLSLETIWRLYDSGQLAGHGHNTNPEAALARTGSGRSKYRYTVTITRESVIAYLIRTATYDHQMKLQWTRDLLDTHSKADLHALASYALSMAAKL
jgi:hypothetical protein